VALLRLLNGQLARHPPDVLADDHSGRQRCRTRPRLQLEWLEDRVVPATTIGVNNAAADPTIAGWGAEYPVESFSVPQAQRPQIITDIYNTLKFTSTQAGSLLESPTNNFSQTQLSDPNPNVINWSGFSGGSEQDTHDNWINAPSTIPDGNGGFLTVGTCTNQ